MNKDSVDTWDGVDSGKLWQKRYIGTAQEAAHVEAGRKK